jgi:gliding motility-associated-like protein
VYVLVYPYTNTLFTFEPETVVVTNPVVFSDATQLSGNVSTGWAWTFGDGQTSDVQNPEHAYSTPGEYQVCLTVLTELGCSEEFCDTITVVPAELELPNIVTPNGDAVNDVLEVKYLPFYPDNEIKVYNRWGNIVFQKKNYANDWSPQSVSDGVYFYIVSINGGKEYSQILHVAK